MRAHCARRRTDILPFCVLLALLAGGVCTSADAQTYTAVNLGTLPGTDTSFAIDVNDRGEVVCQTIYRGYYKHAFYWSAATGMVDMGDAATSGCRINNQGHVLLNGHWVWKNGENGNAWFGLTGLRPGGNSTAVTINDNDEIGGCSDTSDIIAYDSSGTPQYGTTPVLWKQVSGLWTPAALPLPDGDNRGFLYQLTNVAGDGTGQAFGLCGHADYSTGSPVYTVVHVVRWTRSGDVWTVALTGDNVGNDGPRLTARVINAAGDTAGPAIYGPGSDLFVERGACALVTTGMSVYGIDANGNLAGTATLPEGTRAAQRDRLTGIVQSLGTLGGSASWAQERNGLNSYRIANDAGAIVGYSQTAGDKAVHAFVWASATGIRDLDSTAVTASKGEFAVLSCAGAVNNTGCIVGRGTTKKGGFTRAFLLTPR